MLKVLIDNKWYKELNISFKKDIYSYKNALLKVDYSLPGEKTNIKLNKKIVLLLNDKVYFTGKINHIDIKDKIISIYCLNNNYNILQSNYKTNFDLKKYDIVKQLNINVKNNYTFSSNENFYYDRKNELIGDFLENVFHCKNLLLNEDKNGILQLYRNHSKTKTNLTITEKNISSGLIKLDNNILYKNITLYTDKSLNNFLEQNLAVLYDNFEGEYLTLNSNCNDNTEKELCINGKYILDKDTQQNYLKYIYSYYLSKSIQYNIGITGYMLDKKNNFDIGDLIKVKNTFDGVEGVFLISEITLEEGESFFTYLTLCPSSCFTDNPVFPKDISFSKIEF